MVKVGKKINNELQKQKNLVVQVDTDGWQETFLYLTLGSVAFINVNAAIFQVRSSTPLWLKLGLTLTNDQGGILGVAGKFPPAYMGAVFAGQVDILP